MGLITLLVLAIGMAISLGQFQEVPAVEWIRLSESIAREFKAEHVGIKISLRDVPSRMVVTYSSLVDSKYDLSLQNAEMEKVANFAINLFTSSFFARAASGFSLRGKMPSRSTLLRGDRS